MNDMILYAGFLLSAFYVWSSIMTTIKNEKIRILMQDSFDSADSIHQQMDVLYQTMKRDSERVSERVSERLSERTIPPPITETETLMNFIRVQSNRITELEEIMAKQVDEMKYHIHRSIETMVIYTALGWNNTPYAKAYASIVEAEDVHPEIFYASLFQSCHRDIHNISLSDDPKLEKEKRQIYDEICKL